MSFGEILVAGFLLGATGSLHCIGMCGPLSLVLPTASLSTKQKFLSLSLYQVGRILTYIVIGICFGLTGQLVRIAGFQQWFSVIAGSIILLIALSYFFTKANFHFIPFQKFYNWVQSSILNILNKYSGYKSFILLGLANGLLPCGMVYLALAMALSVSNLSHSILFMASFGAGTYPAMMLAGFGLRMINPQLRASFRKIVPIVVALTGILLILRGITVDLNSIGIAYKLEAGRVISCGH